MATHQLWPDVALTAVVLSAGALVGTAMGFVELVLVLFPFKDGALSAVLFLPELECTEEVELSDCFSINFLEVDKPTSSDPFPSKRPIKAPVQV